MKTKEGHLIQANIMLDKLNSKKPMLLYNILKAMQSYADQCVKAREEEIEPLIVAMNDYITILGKELDDCAVMLSVHGWNSKRIADGINSRNKILEIKKKLSTPLSGSLPLGSPSQVEPIQAEQSTLVKCECSVEDTTGWTNVKCCNICGLPIQSEQWDIPKSEKQSPLLDEVKRLRDEYAEIHKKSKFLFNFNKSSMTADDVTYCKNEIRMAKRIVYELTQIINNAKP